MRQVMPGNGLLLRRAKNNIPDFLPDIYQAKNFLCFQWPESLDEISELVKEAITEFLTLIDATESTIGI